MYLKKVTIQNFKLIKKKTTFVLRPITILVGPNSAGKSTLLEAINLIKKLNDYVFDNDQSAFNYLNEINFKDILSSSSKSKIINLEFFLEDTLNSHDYPIKYDENGPVNISDSEGYPITIGDHKLSVKYILKDGNGSLVIDKIIISQSVNFQEDIISQWDKKPQNNSFLLKIFYAKKINQYDFQKLPKKIKSNSAEWSKFLDNFNKENLIGKILSLSNNFYTHYYKVKFTSKFSNFDEVALNITEKSIGAVFANLSSKSKTSPLVERVFCNIFSEGVNLANNIEFKTFQDIVKSSKDYCLDLINIINGSLIYSEIDETRKSPPEIFEYQSGVIKNDFYGMLNSLINTSKGSIKLRDKLLQKLKQFDIADKIEIKTIAELHKSRKFYKILFYWKNNSYYHNKLSSGNKQVIPIILKLTENNSDYHPTNILGIRQPELHLHPKLQMRIADIVFEKMEACNWNDIQIIETHSEHIIRKFQLLVARADMSKNLLKVYYFDPDPNSLECNVISLELNERGMFTKPWPNGFFEESAVLNIQLIEAINSRKN